MASATALPILTTEVGLAHYLEEIRRFPMLERREENMLAKRWREHGDTEAAHKLVTSHLRLVAKIAMGYRGYGLPVSELISEGNVGMMQAVKRFEPDRGFRWIDCSDKANSVVCFERHDEAGRVLVLLNLTPVPRTDYRVGVPMGGVWREVLAVDAVGADDPSLDLGGDDGADGRFLAEECDFEDIRF